MTKTQPKRIEAILKDVGAEWLFSQLLVQRIIERIHENQRTVCNGLSNACPLLDQNVFENLREAIENRSGVHNALADMETFNNQVLKTSALIDALVAFIQEFPEVFNNDEQTEHTKET